MTTDTTLLLTGLGLAGFSYFADVFGIIALAFIFAGATAKAITDKDGR